MKTLTQKEIEDYKQHRWFILHHQDKCSICEKTFGINENAYFGHLQDGTYAYTCEKCCQHLEDAQLYTISHKHPYKIPVPNTKLWRYMDLTKFLSLIEYSSLFFTRLDHFQDRLPEVVQKLVDQRVAEIKQNMTKENEERIQEINVLSANVSDVLERREHLLNLEAEIKRCQEDERKKRLAKTEEYTMLVFSLAGTSVEDVEKVCDIVKLFIETGQVSANRE